MAWNLYVCGRASEAETWARRAVEGYRTQAPGYWRLTDALGSLAAIVRDAKGPAEALPLFEEHAQLRRATGGRTGLWRVYIWTRHAECLMAFGRFADAEDQLVMCSRTLSAEGWRSVPIQVIKTFIKVYGAWDAAEPGRGHDAQADQWREHLPDFARETDPPTPSWSGEHQAGAG